MASPNYVKSWHQSGAAVHIVKSRGALAVVIETSAGLRMPATKQADGSIAVQHPLYLTDTLRRVLLPRAFRWLERQAS